jgi:acetyl-CoA acyltransferase
MGQHAEIMAKKNKISRLAQDEFALNSHLNAAKATDDSRLSEEIIPVFLKNGSVLDKDDGIRSDTSLEKLQKLRPVFDRKYGTVTAGNSSPLTDGASAALLMKTEKAKALGIKPKGFIRSWASSALDPNDQLLLAPAISTPLALKRAGLTLKDIGLLEFHEAFASQVLSVTQNLGSRTFASKYLNSSEATGEVNLEILNVKGGSISIGHPFGATGIRLIASALNEMKKRNVQFGLVTACAAGGLGTTMVLELNNE